MDQPWRDSNPQPLDPKSSALSIAPHGHTSMINALLFDVLLLFTKSYKGHEEKRPKSQQREREREREK